MADTFDPKAFLNDTPSVPVSTSNFDPKAFLNSAPPSVPISGDNLDRSKIDPKDFIKPAEDPRSETEKRLTLDILHKLMVRNGVGDGNYLERASDHLVPGIKNFLGGAVAASGAPFGAEGTVGERYGAGVEAQKLFREYNREKTAGPLGYAADAAGIVASMGKPGPNLAASTAGPTVTATQKAAQTLPGAVKVGATQGVISGAAENSQDLPSAIQGGVRGGITGGVTGAGTQVLTGLIGRLAQNRLNAGAAAERAGQRGPTPDEHFTNAGAKFKELDNAGVRYDQAQARKMGGMLPQVLKDAKHSSTSTTELNDALKSVYEAGAPNALPLTFTELQAIRGKVSAAGQSNPQNPNLRRIAGRVTAMIDDFVNKNQPAVNQSGADVGKLWGEARELWRTGILGDTIQDVEKIAANKAALSGNAEDKARTAVMQQANKDIKSGLPSLPPAAEAARQRAIEGTWKQNTANAVASGSKNWQANLATGAGTGSLVSAATGLPIAATGPVAGLLGVGVGKGVNAAAKGIANREANNNMDTLVRSIMTGSAAKPQSWEMPRDLLASLIARRGVESGAVQAAMPGGDYVINELMKNR